MSSMDAVKIRQYPRPSELVQGTASHVSACVKPDKSGREDSLGEHVHQHDDTLAVNVVAFSACDDEEYDENPR